MANNRMTLVNKSTGMRVAIAKCYSAGWYVTEANLVERLNAAFGMEMDKYYAGLPGTAWAIEYEHDMPEHDALVTAMNEPIADDWVTTESLRPVGK